MDDDVVVMVDGEVKVLQKGAHHDDEPLRRLLDTRPELLLRSAQEDDDQHLLLVSSRTTADELTDQGAVPLERVYVDGQGVPVLVAVQVATHSPADGNVLLRLLDRVAAQLPRWRNGRLRELVLLTHGYRDEADLLASALAWRGGAGAFWGRVESHLARDHVRIILVADELPDELTRAVEFLDAQLRDVEMHAIEVSLFGSGEVFALVPRRRSGGSAQLAARHSAPRAELPPLPQRTAPDWEAGATVLGLHDTDRRAGAPSGGRHRLTSGSESQAQP